MSLGALLRGSVLVAALATCGLVLAQAEPEPPGGPALDGDVLAGAEPAGVDAVEWEALVRGSETAASPKPGLQALLESPNVNLVVFYKNLNRSLAADEDDAYHVYARRCALPETLSEDCGVADLVFDHLIYTRTPNSAGGYDYTVESLNAENPVGTPAPVTPLNPFGLPALGDIPGAVSVADRDDAARDPRALASLAEEIAAATGSVTETSPATENGVVRHFVPVENTSYPYPYERLAAVFDDSDGPDLFYVQTPSGDGPRGNHGTLDITQSRATLLVSGRGARRTPLSPEEEATFEVKHVDLAPTVAQVLGIPVHAAGKLLNAGTAGDNPAAEAPLLLRQDGKPLEGLLEPRVNSFVVVIDGMLPENLNATDTPNLCNLIDCPGAAAPDPSARATVYQAARAVMVSQTNANHTAMLTGAYGEINGVVANNFYNRADDEAQPLERPELIRVDTLFDVLRQELPHLKTAAVLGKAKLRDLYECTNDGANCIAGDTNNPEGEAVTHVRPDFLRGALELPEINPDECFAEAASGSGVTLDECVMDEVIELSATEDPDFTFVNLGDVDGLQHVNGSNSPLGDAAVTNADIQLGRLVSYLKESGKWEQSVLFVTADHSFSYQGPPPLNRVDLAAVLAPCDDLTGETFSVVSHAGAASVYLHSIGVTDAPLTLSQRTTLQCMRSTALAQLGVSEAWYRQANSLDPGKTLAGNRPDWHLDDQRAGDLLVTALASGPTAGPLTPTAPGGNAFEVASGPGTTLASPGATFVIPGDHGHPGARHVPFLVISGGDHVIDQSIAPTGAVNEGDDSGDNPGQAEAVDIGPTVAWIYGLDPSTAMPDAQGRVLSEAFTGPPIDEVEPRANRAVIVIFDANNSVRVHELVADCDETSCANPENRPIPALESLISGPTDARSAVPRGTLTAYGSIATMPTVTFPNHNVVGSGVYPGHHGIVGNRYYERDVEREQDPIDPTDPRNPLFFFSSALLRLDFETLHEAVHRGFGDWATAPGDPGCDPDAPVCGPDGAFTASVDEPSARGADFASLETVSSDNFPVVFAGLVANSAEFLEDSDLTCGQQDPAGYGQELVLDHLGQAQARSLYADPSTSSLTRPAGVDPLIADQSAGVAHPDPKYLIMNFTLTDGAGHTNGPHGNCTRRSYGDTSSRLGRVLAEMRNHGRFVTEGEPARAGETFLLMTGDHGMGDQDQAQNGGFDSELAVADVEYVRQGTFLYFLTLDVDIVSGLPLGGLPRGLQATLTVEVFDSDLREDGSRTPIAGALVSAESDAGLDRSGITDANGRVVLHFVPDGDTARLVVDRDGDGSQGGRTLGSGDPDPDPDPATHGQVTKSDYNDRVIDLPLAD